MCFCYLKDFNFLKGGGGGERGGGGWRLGGGGGGGGGGGSASTCLSRGRPVRFASKFVFAQGTQLLIPDLTEPAKKPRSRLISFQSTVKNKQTNRKMLRRQLCDSLKDTA